MRRALFLPAAMALVVLGGCTIYTACPTDQAPPPPPANTGGSSNGGTTNLGGEGGSDTGGLAEPTGTWKNETYDLVDFDSECGNVSYLSARPDEDELIVGIARHGLLHKTSAAKEWTPIGQGAGSAKITNRANSFVFDPDHPDTYWESGIYNGGGVYRTDDGGDTFIDLGIMHNDVVSVDFSDPDRQVLLASGHEQLHKLYKSTDGGESWTEIGDKLPDEVTVCPNPLVLDASTYLLGCWGFSDGQKGIWRTTDGGDTWAQVSDIGGGTVPLVASDGRIYWVGESLDGIVRSDDDGKTWQGPYLSGETAFVNPIELPDGRIAIVARQHVITSSNHGETWKVASSGLDFDPNGVAYSAAGNAFYVWHWDCDESVPEDAVMSYELDDETE